jgi:hypothetical protein
MRGEVEVGEAEAEKQRTHTARARALLAVFNEIAGTSFGAQGFVDRIASCLIARPDIDDARHRQIVELALSGPPWWGDGKPSPDVIYKSPEQFERTLEGTVPPRVNGHRRAIPDYDAGTIYNGPERVHIEGGAL